MGLRPLEFYQTSPRDFGLMLEGYRARKLDDYKLNRNLMFIMVKLWSSKPINSPQELWDLGDGEPTQNSDDELAKLFEAVKQKENNG